MNILCIAPYHVSGTLSLWKREFASRGHRFRYVTMFRSPFGFEEDICLDLPLQPKSEAFIKARTLAYKVLRGHEPDDMPISTRPPVQPSPHPAMQAFFEMRDILLAPRIQSALEQLNLDDADIIWLDQGAEFFRDGRTVRRWAELGKPMMAFYHGSDMRNRGILPQIDKHLNLRLTSEVDLLYLDDRLEYLFLPIDLSDDVYSDEVDQHAHDIYVVDDPKAGDTLGTKFPPELMSDEPSRLDKQGTRRTRAGQTSSNGTSQEKLIRIGHAARVRSNKGSNTIIEVVTDMRLRGMPVEMVMIENLSHAKALQLKASCDIFIDQIADSGGWGYGMSGVEALAMGLPTITRMGSEMQEFVTDHPFIDATSSTLEHELTRLIEDPVYRETVSRDGREWVERTHSIHAVANQLCDYWKREGWM